MKTPDDAVALISAAAPGTKLPIVAQMTFAEDLRTPQGHPPEQVFDLLSGLSVDVIGANCSVGSNALLEITEPTETRSLTRAQKAKLRDDDFVAPKDY